MNIERSPRTYLEVSRDVHSDGADAALLERTEQKGASMDPTNLVDAPPANERASAGPAPKQSASSLPEQRPKGRRRLFLAALGVLVLAALLWFGVPWIEMTLSTVSTDDAYVNGHATFVAARVPGQVARVLVDDNNRVRKGDLLVQLDKEPYETAVAVKKAAVEIATADLRAATAKVRGVEAQARSRRWTLQHAIESVDNQVALLRARVAALEKSKANLVLAQIEFDRAAKLVGDRTVSQELYDQRQATLSAARAEVAQALADVQQIRVSLGLPPQPEGGDLSQVPPNLDQTFSSVLEAQAELVQSAAQLGVTHAFGETPKEMVEAFEKEGDVNATFARLATEAPDVKQAEARLDSANRDLAQAELDLRYCDVIADMDGVISRRNVNPGDYVQAGQGLMANRSLTDIWIDANFKETQLRDLRIGQPVDLYLDVYGDRHVFQGRVSGFTIGTGSTLALLPAQNATGNFIKVVQRLPVRIEVENYDPDKLPLFIGSSVVPYVYINKPPTGPNAGKFLQTYLPSTSSSMAAPDAKQ